MTKSKSLSHTVKDNLRACRKSKQVLEGQVHQVTREKVGRRIPQLNSIYFPGEIPEELE